MEQLGQFAVSPFSLKVKILEAKSHFGKLQEQEKRAAKLAQADGIVGVVGEGWLDEEVCFRHGSASCGMFYVFMFSAFSMSTLSSGGLICWVLHTLQGRRMIYVCAFVISFDRCFARIIGMMR